LKLSNTIAEADDAAPRVPGDSPKKLSTVPMLSSEGTLSDIVPPLATTLPQVPIDVPKTEAETA
jgi:hypothetical protein